MRFKDVKGKEFNKFKIGDTAYVYQKSDHPKESVNIYKDRTVFALHKVLVDSDNYKAMNTDFTQIGRYHFTKQEAESAFFMWI